MIRINLFGEQRDKTPLLILHGLVLGLALFVTIGGCIAVQTSIAGEFAEQESEKARLDQRLAKLKQKTQKVDELEAKKKLLAEKLNTIASLKVRKQGPVHVMDELTKAMPIRAWLTSVAQAGDKLDLAGVAIDPQTVSEFMRKIQESIYFTGAELAYSRGISKDSVKLQEFSISASLTSAADLQKLRQAGQTSGEPSAVEPVQEQS